MGKRQLTPVDYRRAAMELQCETAAIRAVAEVEAPGGGFLSDGRLRVLFEGHVFYKETFGKFAQSHPTLCHPRWTREHYARGKTAEERGAGELGRLNAAIGLDRTAALKSASYGKFQIVGFNHSLCNYPDVESFHRAMGLDEQAQLDAFCHFVKSKGLVGALRAHDWASFARAYNGAGFRENDYDGKIARAYRRLVAEEKPAAVA